MASRFRVKKLSPKHPLPVFKEKQLPDLDEANLQRAVPQIETGVEKDEEEEVKYSNMVSWWCVVCGVWVGGLPMGYYLPLCR